MPSRKARGGRPSPIVVPIAFATSTPGSQYRNASRGVAVEPAGGGEDDETESLL